MISQIIGDALLKDQKERADRQRSGLWNPSSFGRCYRYQYWNRLNEKQTNPPDDRALRVFRMGYMVEEFVLSYAPEGDRQVLVQTPDVKGFADYVRDNEVWEIKSQHSRAFWYMHKNDFTLEENKKEHILQGMYYVINLGKEYLRLVYVSKDDLCIQEYLLQKTDYWVGELEKELITLNGYYATQTLPPAVPRCYKDKEGNPRECKYCGFLDKCKEAENAT